jgi:acyl carrier protein
MDKKEIMNRIREKVIELARQIGTDASQVDDEEILPATGLLDSAGILGLIVWYEEAFDMHLEQEEINIDNLGSIASMADYVLKRKAGLV